MTVLGMVLAATTTTQAFLATPMAMSRGGSVVAMKSSSPAMALRPHKTLLSGTFASGSQRIMCPKLEQPKRGSSVAGGMEMNFVKEGVMRVVSCMPYILPMMDSLSYGRFLFQKVPLLAFIFMKPLQPFVELAQAFPMISFVAFLGLFLFVVRNKAVPRFIRFNTMQALLLEIMLIFPQILTSSNMGGVIPFMFTEFVSNMTFYAIASIVGYSCFSNLMGNLPCKIPVVSTAVFQQIGGGAGYDQ
mmetsp:Transcript_48272/g.98581  ORF Transcript_48272/g.98581 Transcript_48272/m.98581 type:complete len:245 (-) Transcript_48272:104-838(-)